MKIQQLSKNITTSCFVILFISVITLFLVNFGSIQPSIKQKQENTFHKIKREGILRVGYILASPWCFLDPETNELKGTFIETVGEIARQMDVKVEFTESTFGTFIAGLLTKKYDLSIAPTFTTIPRAKSVAFSIPLMAAGNSAIVLKNESRFKTLSDIDQEGIVVAVTQGEQGHEYAKVNFKKAEIRVLSGGDQSLTFSEVLAGRADIALGDAWFSAKFAAEHPQTKDLFEDNPYNVTPVAWSVRYEDTSLLTFINTVLEYLDTTGKLQEIDNKYDVHWLRPKRIWEKS